MRSLQFALLLLATTTAWADPLPVKAYLDTPFANEPNRLRLQQDSCFSWGVPDISVALPEVRVSQTVTPISACTSPTPQAASIVLPALPVGEYRLLYTPVPVGPGPLPPTTLEFEVRPRATNAGVLALHPNVPTALEPVEAKIVVEICESFAGVRLVDGAIRIELDRDGSSPISCDAGYMLWVTLGAFPPGQYRVEVALLPEDGGRVKGGTDFTVHKEAPNARDAGLPRPDFSGLWFSANEELSTGMSIVHTRLPSPIDGAPGDALIAIWYRYDAAGRPEWYWIEAVRGAYTGYRGSIYAYTPEDPQAPGWQRRVNATPVGTVTIFPGHPDYPTRVDAVLHGENVHFSLCRLRWQRSAWPTPAPAG